MKTWIVRIAATAVQPISYNVEADSWKVTETGGIEFYVKETVVAHFRLDQIIGVQEGSQSK